MNYIFRISWQYDENGHSDRSIDCNINKQKAIEQERCCKFIRINPNKEGFDIFRTITKYLDISKNQLKNSNK